VVWATLAGAQSERVRSALARRLGVSLRELNDLIGGARAEPRRARLFADVAAADVADPPSAEPSTPRHSAQPSQHGAEGGGPPRSGSSHSGVDGGQIDLGL
jgi:hypothetical protein